MPRYPHIQRFFDLLILAAVAASLIFVIPKLVYLATETVAALGEELSPAQKSRSWNGVFLVGLLVLSGAIALIIPCHSWFGAPAAPLRRALLAVVVFIPLAIAVLGMVVGPLYMKGAFTRLGLLCSSGGWVFAFPVVFGNRSLSDVISSLRGPPPSARPRKRPRTTRRPPRR